MSGSWDDRGAGKLDEQLGGYCGYVALMWDGSRDGEKWMSARDTRGKWCCG